MPAAGSLLALLESASVAGATVSEEPMGTLARVPATVIVETLSALKDAGYAMFVDLFATDTGEGLELTYHLRRLEDLDEVRVRASVPYDGEAPSAWRVFPATLYPEREAAELFGMTFAAHPNPRRLLTSDETPGFLLRKSVPIRSEEEMTMRGRV